MTKQLAHGVNPFIQSTNNFAASTPLRKPAANNLRNSSTLSFSNRRSSRSLLNRSTLMESFSLKEVDESKGAPGSDDTPTGALRRLEGNRDDSTMLAQRSSGQTLQKSVTVTQQPRTTNETPKIGHRQPLPSQSGPLLEPDKMEKLLPELISLLQSVSALRSPNTCPDSSVDAQLSTMKNMLNDTEKRSEVREARLQNLVSAVSFPRV